MSLVKLFSENIIFNGIIVYYKKTISRGVTYVNYGSKSENRLWLKLDKSFFDI
jgi:hypothetical protein